MSSLDAMPEISSLVAIPDKSSLDAMPEISSLVAIPDKSSLDAMPDISSLVAIPDRSSLDAMLILISLISLTNCCKIVSNFSHLLLLKRNLFKLYHAILRGATLNLTGLNHRKCHLPNEIIIMKDIVNGIYCYSNAKVKNMF